MSEKIKTSSLAQERNVRSCVGILLRASVAPVFTTMTTSEPREGYARQAGFTGLDPEGWKDELACKSGDDDSACEGGWTGDDWDPTCAFDSLQDFSSQKLGSRAK